MALLNELRHWPFVDTGGTAEHAIPSLPLADISKVPLLLTLTNFPVLVDPNHGHILGHGSSNVKCLPPRHRVYRISVVPYKVQQPIGQLMRLGSERDR